jgi:hypothetical protein
MKKVASLIIVIAIASCSAGSKEWPKDERDKFTNSCVTKAMAADNGLQEEGVRKYCNCYREKMEVKYPDIKDLEKVNIEELTKAAQDCLPLMTQ